MFPVSRNTWDGKHGRGNCAAIAFDSTLKKHWKFHWEHHAKDGTRNFGKTEWESLLGMTTRLYLCSLKERKRLRKEADSRYVKQAEMSGRKAST